MRDDAATLALGPLGVNMMDFCKQFNERTTGLVEGIPTPVVLVANPDRTFSFETKTPPTSWFLKRVAGVEKGSGSPGHSDVGSVTLREVFEIAKVKQADIPHVDVENVVRAVMGSAKSMGIQIDEEASR